MKVFFLKIQTTFETGVESLGRLGTDAGMRWGGGGRPGEIKLYGSSRGASARLLHRRLVKGKLGLGTQAMISERKDMNASTGQFLSSLLAKKSWVFSFFFSFLIFVILFFKRKIQ